MNGYFDENGHPRITVELEGLRKEFVKVSCLLDTGFDGSRRNELLYFCKLKFEKEERFIPVSLSGSATPLFGTKLLLGKRLLINFKSQTVRIINLKKSKGIIEIQQLKLMKKQIRSD